MGGNCYFLFYFILFNFFSFGSVCTDLRNTRTDLTGKVLVMKEKCINTIIALLPPPTPHLLCFTYNCIKRAPCVHNVGEDVGNEIASRENKK